MLLKPQNFRSSEARENRIANCFNRFFWTSKLFRDFVALCRGGCVAPQFCRPNDLAICVQRHKAMLLTAHANGFDFTAGCSGLAQCATDAAGRGFAPCMRMLL